jgi:hypothetical protein
MPSIDVVDAADWYGTEPAAPPARFVDVVAVVAEPAVVAEVAVAAFPPMLKDDAVPVKPVPGPLNCVDAVIVVPPTVEPLIGVPEMLPPVIATLLAFCVDIVPNPVTCELGIEIAVLLALVT